MATSILEPSCKCIATFPGNSLMTPEQNTRFFLLGKTRAVSGRKKNTPTSETYHFKGLKPVIAKGDIYIPIYHIYHIPVYNDIHSID